MMKRVEMPEVKDCSVSGCIYNREKSCRARGITMGDLQGHICDTMMPGRMHSHRDESAGVGACRAANCMHNEDFECQADAVEVSMAKGEAQCMTFKAR